MNEIKIRKYNKGEWSEILTCFKILSTKEWKINFGDENGNKTEDYLLISDLFHINEKYHYCLNNNQYYLKLNDNLIAKYTFKETFEIIEKLKKEILTGNRAFSIQDNEIQNFLDKHKITKLKSQVESLGYETYLLAVNTDLETAMERNRNRARKLPDDKVKEMWLAVRNNMTYYKSIFKKNFLTVVNNKEDSPSKQSMIARKLLINGKRSFSPCDVCDVSGSLIGSSHARAWSKILDKK